MASRRRGQSFVVDVALGAADIELLFQATSLKVRRKLGEITSAEYKAAQASYAAALNAMDTRVMRSWSPQTFVGGAGQIRGVRRTYVSLRPYAYVPAFNSKGQLSVPHTGRSGRIVGGRRMPLLGKKHMAIIGFVTRDRKRAASGRRSSMIFSGPGQQSNLRLRVFTQPGGRRRRAAGVPRLSRMAVVGLAASDRCRLGIQGRRRGVGGCRALGQYPPQGLSAGAFGAGAVAMEV